MGPGRKTNDFTLVFALAHLTSRYIYIHIPREYINHRPHEVHNSHIQISLFPWNKSEFGTRIAILCEESVST
jgi:hypothetical protein